VSKQFSFRGGVNRLKLTMDTFNIFNTATVLGYSSNNASNALAVGGSGSFNSPSSIVPPRVIRFGVSFTF
jgi:hypothetical protein